MNYLNICNGMVVCGAPEIKMIRNSITNQMELNGQECHLLRKLDETVERDGSAIIGTQFGDVLVRKATRGFIAHMVENKWRGTFNHGAASSAFLQLANKLRGAN